MADAEHTMVFITFDGKQPALDAFGEAKAVHGVQQAAVLVRTAEGLLDTPESWVRGAGTPTVATGIVGGLLGLFGGPIGVLLGWTAGTVLGGAAELKRFQTGAEGLLVFSKDLTEGHAMLIVEAHETDPALLDMVAEQHGGRVARRPAAEVEAEVKAAETAAEEAARAERGEL
ncbi:histidine kinase [Streptomyces tateyamensis]|uniref:Histidine kinase n=1 Tax=Streptomyces tateyamensis TaxID=565073 RepID=A0A2V4N144_9ACTN|nr:histidine kinase [Streptomyces tateyamensis]PYC75822.1 histidine kinase [Streptomyces tateyamensis]